MLVFTLFTLVFDLPSYLRSPGVSLAAREAPSAQGTAEYRNLNENLRMEASDGR